MGGAEVMQAWKLPEPLAVCERRGGRVAGGGDADADADDVGMRMWMQAARRSVRWVLESGARGKPGQVIRKMVISLWYTLHPGQKPCACRMNPTHVNAMHMTAYLIRAECHFLVASAASAAQNSRCDSDGRPTADASG